MTLVSNAGMPALPHGIFTKSAPTEEEGIAILTKAIETSNKSVAEQLTKLTDAGKEARAQLEKHESYFFDLGQKLAQGRSLGGGGEAFNESLGSRIKTAPEIEQFREAGLRGRHRIQVKALTSASNSAGGLIAPDRQTEVVPLPTRPLTIRDLLNATTTTSNLIQITRLKSRTINAAVVAESAQKPESSMDFELVEFPVATIAHWVSATRQAFDDGNQLAAIIDTELVYGLKYVEEVQILNGSGAAGNLKGIYTAASDYLAPFTVAGASMIDQLALALLQAELAGYPATGIVLHPNDWTRVTLMKDSMGRYILGDPQTGAQPALWGRPVVASQAMAEDKFLVGAFGTAAQIFDRLDAEVLISDEDRDNFIKNMLTIRAEERLALVNRRPGALVKGDLGNIANN